MSKRTGGDIEILQFPGVPGDHDRLAQEVSRQVVEYPCHISELLANAVVKHHIYFAGVLKHLSNPQPRFRARFKLPDRIIDILLPARTPVSEPVEQDNRLIKLNAAPVCTGPHDPSGNLQVATAQGDTFTLFRNLEKLDESTGDGQISKACSARRVVNHQGHRHEQVRAMFSPIVFIGL